MRTGTKLAIAALALALTSFFVWFATNQAVGIPEDRTLFVLSFLTAAGLGVAANIKGTNLLGRLATLPAIFIGLLIPFTVAISAQGVGADSIKVGDTIPHFTAVNEHGKTFDSNALQGHLVLIKFFRAHW